MNKRFQELHNQARDFYHQDEYLDLSTKELHRLVEQKFAELIVKECAEIADYADATREKWQGIGKFVREHFGVKL